ncbi:YusW family protein [Oceanobacillus longus]|uniref:YusW family protein n=1 Tax=Oceanobacillus longus TaxID=930120 RepID=A0ABV8GYA4_9BACI
MKRKFLTLITFILLASVIAACGNEGENTTENEGGEEVTESPEEFSSTEADNQSIDDSEKTEVDTESDHQYTDMGDGTRTDSDGTDTTKENNNNNRNPGNEADYTFTSFDLEADFEGTEDAVDVDYEMDGEKSEASYTDKLQGIQLAGDEAMQELDSIFSTFEFDENTSDEEVLNAVFEAFKIPKDAKNVELEIDYIGGTEKEYKQ